jgi:hypothetical protein
MTLEGADLVHAKRTERIESPIYKKFGNALEIMKKIRVVGLEFVHRALIILELRAVTSMIG